MLRDYRVTLTGTTPLIHHYDNIAWADAMERWKNDPHNKKSSKAGDDRTPAFRWLGSLYHNGTVVAIPADNIARVLMEGGALVPVPGGRNGKTFKAQSQSGLQIVDLYWPLLVRNKPIPVAPLLALQEESDFATQVERVRAAGFELFVKRAKIGASKHVRVRPYFSEWQASGAVAVIDDQITKEVLVDILTYAGKYKGLGDWRPSSPKAPGPFGRFTVTVQ